MVPESKVVVQARETCMMTETCKEREDEETDRQANKHGKQTRRGFCFFSLLSPAFTFAVRESSLKLSSCCRRLIDPVSHQGPWLLHHYHLDVFFGTPPRNPSSLSKTYLTREPRCYESLPTSTSLSVLASLPASVCFFFSPFSRHLAALLCCRAPLNCSAQFRHGLTRAGLHFISSRRRRRNID